MSAVLVGTFVALETDPEAPNIAPAAQSGSSIPPALEEPGAITPAPPAVPVAPTSVEPGAPLFDSPLPLQLESIPDGLASLSAQGCNACHFETHKQ